MAIMIPEMPRDYDPVSLEGAMFDALKKLPEDYYIVHSFKNVYVEENVLHEGEADFVIFNPTKYSLQGTTQGRYLTGGVPPVRFSM